MSERQRRAAKAVAGLEKLAIRVADAADLSDEPGDLLDYQTSRPELLNAVWSLMEFLVAERLEERRAEVTCPDCGGRLESTVWETRDPADDRMRCEDCGEASW